MTKLLTSLVLVMAVAGLQTSAQSGGTASKPTRVNKAIELLEQGQAIYYDTASGGGYEAGRKYAQTAGDYINYEMEHGAFDLAGLREFMRGLVDGGPTKSGHPTPAVIATLPVLGLDEAGMRANSWVVQQVLAAGVHGILLCHARSPEAARVMIEAARYPFAPKVEGLDRGLRGSGSQTYAARIWGIPANEYVRKADPWPLNREGELLFGVKIEDSFALENAEKTTRVPGVGFAEWGPGDMGFWLVGPPESGRDPVPLPLMQQARSRVFNATKAAKIFFLNSCNASNVAAMLKEGVMICAGLGGAETGRKLTKRAMPW
jgi:4-hydroxy-2-oxoheptanedioate aldolase